MTRNLTRAGSETGLGLETGLEQEAETGLDKVLETGLDTELEQVAETDRL